jgi:UDP-N-acetyl-D-galactosamine dehydrogenase
MGKFVVENTVKSLIKASKTVKGSKVLILGITFKENVPDTRNSRVIDMIKELESFGIKTYVYDPYAYPDEVKADYGIELLTEKELFSESPYDGVIVAVKHKKFIESFDLKKIKSFLDPNHKPILIDIKGIYDLDKAKSEGFIYWRL